MYFNLLSTATWYLWRFDTPLLSLRTVAIWLTAALVIAFFVLFAVLGTEKRKKLVKSSLTFAVCYACTLSLIFMALSFSEDAKDGALNLLLLLPLSLLVLSILVTAVLLTRSKSKKTKQLLFLITGILFIVTLIAMGIRFSSGDSAELNGLNKEDVNSLWLYVAAITVTVIIVAAGFIFDKGYKGFDTRSITYAGALIAMSYALSYLKIVRMPQGGSITVASLLPLMLYSYIFGTKKGVFVGLIYGLLQALQDPYIIHPAQFLLDYPLAFGAVGLSGIFAKNKKLEKMPQLKFAFGAVIGGLSRFIMHFLAGAFAFAAFSGTQNPFIYSFVYQAGYVLPDMAVTIVVGMILLSSKSLASFVASRGQKQTA